MPDQSIAVVIVSFNVRDELDACLASFVGHTHPFSTTVVVVDNGSTDGTQEMLREKWPTIQLIESSENLGFARANNTGVRATSGEFVLFLNPDTIVPPGSIPSLVRGLAAQPDAAAAGPRLKDEHGFPELSFGWTIGPLGELRQKVIGTLYNLRVRWMVRTVDAWSRSAGEREWVSGAALLVRRKDLESVGLFDERFFMYTEDIDLCAAVRAQGKRVLFVPTVEVVHLRGRSAATAPRATRALYRRSHVAFYEKHHPRWAALLKVYLRAKGEWPPSG